MYFAMQTEYKYIQIYANIIQIYAVTEDGTSYFVMK